MQACIDRARGAKNLTPREKFNIWIADHNGGLSAVAHAYGETIVVSARRSGRAISRGEIPANGMRELRSKPPRRRFLVLETRGRGRRRGSTMRVSTFHGVFAAVGVRKDRISGTEYRAHRCGTIRSDSQVPAKGWVGWVYRVCAVIRPATRVATARARVGWRFAWTRRGAKVTVDVTRDRAFSQIARSERRIGFAKEKKKR